MFPHVLVNKTNEKSSFQYLFMCLNVIVIFKVQFDQFV